ncbi:hypothetical protein V6N13_029540 [Hibiscus sabdariffa]
MRLSLEERVDSAHYVSREGVKELKTTRSGYYVSIDELGSHFKEMARRDNENSFGLTPFPSPCLSVEGYPKGI